MAKDVKGHVADNFEHTFTEIQYKHAKIIDEIKTAIDRSRASSQGGVANDIAKLSNVGAAVRAARSSWLSVTVHLTNGPATGDETPKPN